MFLSFSQVFPLNIRHLSLGPKEVMLKFENSSILLETSLSSSDLKQIAYRKETLFPTQLPTLIHTILKHGQTLFSIQ